MDPELKKELEDLGAKIEAIDKYNRRRFGAAFVQSVGVAGLPLFTIGLVSLLYEKMNIIVDQYFVMMFVGLMMVLIGYFKKEHK
jgi:hypothetical protein